MSSLYQWINPPVKCLLKSPFHRLLSSNTLLLEFTGRKSGRSLSTPISYYIKDGTARCFTSQSFRWWWNLTNNQSVTLTIAGRKYRSTPLVVTDDLELMQMELTDFLRAVPRDAPHSGVSLDASGQPNQQDIKKVVPQMVFLRFPLREVT